MKKTKNSAHRYDVVERYCPKCNENVILQRIQGMNTTYKCINYESCKEEKGVFCANGKIT